MHVPFFPPPPSSCFGTARKIDREGYVQGLNVVAGMLLSCMPEPDAFECFRRLVLDMVPRYFRGMVDGSVQGCRLAVAVLRLTDWELYCHMTQNSQFDAMLLHQSVLGMLANHPPLAHARRMWDLFVAFGFGLVPVAVAASLVAVRRERLAAAASTAFRDASSIDARVLAPLTLAMAARLPPDLLRLLHRHPRVPVDDSEYVTSTGLTSFFQ